MSDELMRNIHIFDAISISTHRPKHVKRFRARACAAKSISTTNHKRAPEVALCDARQRSTGTVTTTPRHAVQSPARAHRVACALHLAPTGVCC